MRDLVLPALALLSLGACASGKQGTGGAPSPKRELTVVEKNTNGNVQYLDWRPDVYSWTFAVAAPPAKAWSTLPAVYAQLGLTGGVLDGPKMVFGATRARFRRQLAGQLHSKWLNCGEQLGLRNADNNTLLLNIMTAIVPAPEGGGSVVQTQITGLAQPESRTSNPVQCTSNGKLEAEIAAMVGARVREMP